MDERLDSWKDIAVYLERDIRTVQRWSLNRRLPVRRVPGGDKPRVFAFKSEIEEWLRSAGRELAVRQLPSVAVLPFVNLSGDKADECFGDGLADDVIDALARFNGLRVTARSSSFAFRNAQQDVREIGSQLGAATLLEGSIRRVEDRVRISAQLVSAKDGYHLWSERYDRRVVDMFAIQTEIAHSIALALKLRLAPESVVKHPTGNPEAYELWVRGRSLGAQYSPESFARALDCYKAAIALDPSFAQPYADTAELLFHAAEFAIGSSPGAIRQARDAVLKALELNDSLGEAHALLGIVRGVVEYDWAGAELSFQRALQLCPGSAAVLLRHAWYCLLPQKKFTQALHEVEEAAAQDPLSPLTHSIFGLTLMVTRQLARAEEECRVAMDLAPGLWWPQWFLGATLLLRGKLIRGFKLCRKVYERYPREPGIVGAMCQVYAQFFRRKKAQELLGQLTDLARTSDVPPIAFAYAYLGLRDDRAFEWLDKAIEAHDPTVPHMSYMPFYDSVRNDPRFQARLARMRLA